MEFLLAISLLSCFDLSRLEQSKQDDIIYFTNVMETTCKGKELTDRDCKQVSTVLIVTNDQLHDIHKEQAKRCDTKASSK